MITATDNVIRNIRYLITTRGYKQNAIAQKAGYTEQDMSNMLNKRKIIKAEDIVNICRALGVCPNEVFGVAPASTTDQPTAKEV